MCHNLFFLVAELYSVAWIYRILFNHSSINEHLGCLLTCLFDKVVLSAKVGDSGSVWKSHLGLLQSLLSVLLEAAGQRKAWLWGRKSQHPETIFSQLSSGEPVNLRGWGKAVLTSFNNLPIRVYSQCNLTLFEHQKEKNIATLCVSCCPRTPSVPARAQSYSDCPALSPSLREPANRNLQENGNGKTLYECECLCLRTQNAFTPIYVLLEDTIKVPSTIIKVIR